MDGLSDRGGLSHRRRAVLALIATGLTTREAAEALEIPADEVRADIRGAIYALGARSKLEAVLVALRQGLIPPNGRIVDMAAPRMQDAGCGVGLTTPHSSPGSGSPPDLPPGG